MSATASAPASSPPPPGASASSGPRRSARCVATHVVETVGTQEYAFSADGFLERFEQAYGEAAADEVRPHLQP